MYYGGAAWASAGALRLRMADFGREVRKLLSDHECRFYRQGRGDHEIWWSPITSRCFTVDKKIKSRHTANETLKQAGIGKQF